MHSSTLEEKKSGNGFLNSRKTAILVCVILGLSLSGLYCAYSSNAPFAGDGGWRLAQEEHGAQEPHIGRNRHLLFKIHHYYFARFLETLGNVPENRFDFFKQETIFSGIAGGAGASLVFVILYLLSRNTAASLWGALAVAFSNPYLIHATHPSEPVPALAVSFLAIIFFIMALRRLSGPAVVASGVLLGYAFSSYVSMLAYFPGMFFLLIYFAFSFPEKRKRYVWLLFLFCLSVFGSIALIYSAVYMHFLGLENPVQFWREFIKDEKAEFGFETGYSWNRFYALGEGFLRSIFQVPNVTVSKDILLALKQDDEYDERTFLSFSLLIFLLAVGWMILVNRTRERNIGKKTGMFALFMIPPLLAPAYYHATYTKLWLQPVAAFFVMCAWQMAVFMKMPVRRLYRLVALAVMTGFLALQIFWNLQNTLFKNYIGDTDLIHAAEQIYNEAEENSLLLIYAPSISLLTQIFFSDRHQVEMFTGERFESAEALEDHIDAAIRKADAEERAAYVVLEEKKHLDRMPPARRRIYEVFDRLRRQGGRVQTYEIDRMRYLLRYFLARVSVEEAFEQPSSV